MRVFEIFAIISSLMVLAIGSQAQRKKPNVVFIMVDDLRPDLGCYGNNVVKSPNIDRLASKSVVFRQQYVTVPTCGASRASILTGKLPRNIGELGNGAMETKTAQNDWKTPESFIHYLKMNGYYTVGIGKISHSPDGYIYNYLQPRSDRLELVKSWDEMLFDAGKWGTGWNAFFGYADGTNRNSLNNLVKPYENSAIHDEDYPDGLTAKLAVKKLEELSSSDQPFFLGVGFFKPHLPFNAPKKYWDLYDEASIELSPAIGIPKNVNLASLHNSDEFNNYKIGERARLLAPLSDAYARRLRHAYYASVSYVDAQIGKVLDELTRVGLDKNTIVIIWGDHGWHLGDHNVWGKHTLFDWSLRSPLIVKAPARTKGASSDKIVSAVDVYPTLVELCGLKPLGALDGRSFVPLLKNHKKSGWDNAAFSYFRKGVSVRTDNYRLTKYFREERPVIELYDYRTDPYEKENIATRLPEEVKSMMQILAKRDIGLYIRVKKQN